MRYGYVSNGFLDHSLEQMVQVISSLGYVGIGLTLDHMHLDPLRATEARLDEVRDLFRKRGLTPVIETGARYYLDPFQKHRPSLVCVGQDGRRARIDYYRRAIDIAAHLGAKCVSLWSGVPQTGTSEQLSWDRLVVGLREVCDHAESLAIRIGFEPEPGMLVENLNDYRLLRERLEHPALALTLDLGHLAITEEEPLESHIEQWGDHIVNVHIEDIRDREHVHLPFGEGNLDIPPLLVALRRVSYEGLVLVELSRNNADAPVQAQRSITYLRNIDTP